MTSTALPQQSFYPLKPLLFDIPVTLFGNRLNLFIKPYWFKRELQINSVNNQNPSSRYVRNNMLSNDNYFFGRYDDLLGYESQFVGVLFVRHRTFFDLIIQVSSLSELNSLTSIKDIQYRLSIFRHKNQRHINSHASFPASHPLSATQ